MNNQSFRKRMYRSHDRILGGVLAGFAEFINYDITIIRVLYVVLSLLLAGFPGLLIYVILWAITPEAPR